MGHTDTKCKAVGTLSEFARDLIADLRREKHYDLAADTQNKWL